MKFWLSFIFISTLAISISATPDNITPWTDWPTVSVPADAPESQSISTQLVWQLDCSVDADDLVGKIISAAPGANDTVLLVDQQLVSILVVGPDGQIVRTVGQPGEGPGDLPGAYRAFQLADGRIGVSGGAPALTISYGGMGKIILLDQAGDPAGIWYGAGDPGSLPISSVREMRCANDNILTSSHYLKMDESGMTRVLELSLFAPASGRRTVVARHIKIEDMAEMSISERDFYEPFAEGRCDVSVSGRVAFAPQRDPWQVVIRNPDGTGLVLERQWAAVERTKAEKEAVLKALGGGETCTALAHQPAIGRIRWRPDGRLWVEPLGIAPDPGAFACFDEFNPEGQLMRRVQIQVPGDRARDLLVVMEDGRFALLKGFRQDSDYKSIEAVRTEVLLLVAR